MDIFVCDGSPQCFLTAVFDGYNKNCRITSEADLQIGLGDEFISVRADGEKCRRVLDGVLKYDKEAAEDILLALRSCNPDKEQIIFGYIKLLMQSKGRIRRNYNLPEIVKFNDVLYKVTGETHRIKGLLRFMECESGALYAPYSPDNDITELLMPHFAARLSAQKFAIHDVKRKKAGLYNGGEWIMCAAGDAEISLSDSQIEFENLWKKYYKSVNIESRPHEKQMKGSMPVRYWKFLPEKQIDEN